MSYRTLVQSTRSLLMKYWDLANLEWFMEVSVMTLSELILAALCYLHKNISRALNNQTSTVH